MKTKFFKFFVLLLMLQLSKQAFALDFSGGSGTEEDPYLVSSLADYTYIDWEPNAYFKLTCDIEGVTYERGTFNGHLDGNNRYISVNMECRSASLDYGLFKEASGAVFKNITIKGVYTGLVSGMISHSLNIGGICANATSCKFINCHNEATISASAESYCYDSHIGGLAAIATGCTFEMCSNTGTLRGPAWKSESSAPRNYVGGLIGEAKNCHIINCYCVGSVDGGNSEVTVGGMCGNLDATQISNSYSNCTSNKSFGTFAGWARSGSHMKDSFAYARDKWNYFYGATDISPETLSENCYRFERETSEAENPLIQSWYETNLPSWDFENVWYFPSSIALPLLKKETIVSTSSSRIMYGESVTFTSSNPYKELKLSMENAEDADIEGNTVPPLKAGTINVRLQQAAFDEFQPVDKSIRITVTKAPLSITADNASMTYGDDTPELTYSCDGLNLGDTPETALTEKPLLVSSATSTSNAGEYLIAISGGKSDNYTLSLTSGTITVNPRPLTVTPNSVSRKYGSANPTFQVSYSGFVNGDNQSLVTTSPTVTTDATKSSSVGTYTLTCSGGNVYKNYTLKYGVGTLTIEKALLRVKAQNASRTVDEENPEFMLFYEGFKNNESTDDLDVVPYATTTATRNSEPGEYEIVVSGGKALNYEFSYINGVLTVLPSTGIADIMAEKDAVTIYNLQGREQQRYQKGVNIIRTSNGKTYKVLVK